MKIGIVGAGALTQEVYLPILNSRPDLFKVECICDINIELAFTCAEKYNIPKSYKDYNLIDITSIDAVIVVLPNFLHATASNYFLSRKIPVLVEKPMANTTAEALEMIACSKKNNTILCVGLVRRFFPVTDFIKTCLEHQLYGKLISVDIEEGYIFDWAIKSNYLLLKEKAGGGVLMDTGVHALDQILYWLGDPIQLDYKDDNAGGVEAECTLQMVFASKVKAGLRFSRIRSLRNSIVLNFEKVKIEIGLQANASLTITMSDGLSLQTNLLKNGLIVNTKAAFLQQLENFRLSVSGDTICKVDGAEGIKTLQVIEACYSKKALPNTKAYEQ